MKSFFKYSAIGLTTMFLATGCTYKGSALTAVVDISKTDMSKVETLKSGEACISHFLIFPTGLDATAREAAKKAGISKIEYQEYSSTNYILGSSNCIKVYGK